MQVFLKKVKLDQKPDHREKIIFFATLLVFCFVFLKSCWLPSTRALTAVQDEINDLATSEQQVQQGLPVTATSAAVSGAQTLSLEKDFQEWSKRIEELPEAVLMKEFTNASLLKGLKVKDIQFPPALRNGTILQQDFNLVVSGAFLSVVQYLDRLESLPIILNVSSMNMTVTNDAFGKVDVELKGAVYAWK